MIPLKKRLEKATQAAKEIIRQEYTFVEILNALEELRDEIETYINLVSDDVEREMGDGS